MSRRVGKDFNRKKLYSGILRYFPPFPVGVGVGVAVSLKNTFKIV